MSIGRRLVGWIAAYAFVLHGVLTGIVATQFTATKSAAHGFEICLTDPDGAPLPGSNHARHESCAIQCNSVASSAPAVAATSAPPAIPALVVQQIVYSAPTASFDLLRRAGLGSRAPPAA